MIFGKSKRVAKRRRATGSDASGSPATAGGQEHPAGEAPGGAKPIRLDRPGPYDADEVDLDTTRTGRADLGGLQVSVPPGTSLQIETDPTSQSVIAARLISGEQRDAMMDLRAFAASRSAGLWDEIRAESAADISRKGGMVTERRGPFGVELHLAMPVKRPDGRSGTQAQRVIGIDGPRWMLRATLIGRAAQEQAAAALLLRALSDTVVVRGKAPMVPREAIRMTPPAGRAPGAPPADAMR